MSEQTRKQLFERVDEIESDLRRLRKRFDNDDPRGALAVIGELCDELLQLVDVVAACTAVVTDP